MAKIKTLRPSLKMANTSTVKTLRSRAKRITGTELQKVRKRLWVESPCCATCGRTVRYPDGFELDHIVPLWEGGSESDDNRQLLCVHWERIDGELVKTGCHALKTAQEAKERG